MHRIIGYQLTNDAKINDTCPFGRSWQEQNFINSFISKVLKMSIILSPALIDSLFKLSYTQQISRNVYGIIIR